MTSTVPVPAGELAVMEVELFTLKVVAALLPNFTTLAPVKLVPLTVTEVPPPCGPADGFTAVTVGAAT